MHSGANLMGWTESEAEVFAAEARVEIRREAVNRPPDLCVLLNPERKRTNAPEALPEVGVYDVQNVIESGSALHRGHL